MSETRRRMTLVLGTIGLSLAWDVLAALGAWGPWAAFAMTGILLAIFGLYMAFTRDQLIGRLLFFGLVVGLGELLSDHWAVSVSRTLVYADWGPRIWDSPLYMPLSWIVVIAQLGFVARWLDQRWGLLAAVAGATVAGALNIPFYEFLADKAGFWYYRDCWKILGCTPVYVIAGEATLTAVLPLMLRGVARGGWLRILGLGLLQALWIWLVCARLCYALFG